MDTLSALAAEYVRKYIFKRCDDDDVSSLDFNLDDSDDSDMSDSDVSYLNEVKHTKTSSIDEDSDEFSDDDPFPQPKKMRSNIKKSITKMKRNDIGKCKAVARRAK